MASLRENLEALPRAIFAAEGIVIREILDDDDLWYAVVECKLRPGQEEYVNPAGFSIGRAYLHPEDNVPCVICLESGERIGYLVLRTWAAEGDAYSWSYYMDGKFQGQGYGTKAARLAARILKAADGTKPVKLAVDADNQKAQALYQSIGFQKLDEMDGDELVFGL